MHSSTFVTCCSAERSAFRPSGCDRCRFRRAVRNHESPCIRPPRVTAWRQPYAAGTAVQDASVTICSLWVTRKRSALTNNAPIRCVATTPNTDGGRRLLPRAQRAVEREVRHCWGDTHLSFSLLALGVPDFAPVCPRQLAVQSASAARQSFGTAYGTSLLSGGSWPLLHAINT
jgi:hypothetical protein